MVNVLVKILETRLMDIAGRRLLLLVGLAGMAVSMCVLGLGFALARAAALGWVTALSLACYVGSFAVGLGPVFWLLISETFPLAVRGRVTSARRSPIGRRIWRSRLRSCCWWTASGRQERS